MVEQLDRSSTFFNEARLIRKNSASATQLANLTVHDLRRNNRQKILERIYFAGPVTRINLSQYCRLSFSTVATVVNELILKGIVSEFGIPASQGGRPRMLLTINQSYGYFIGIDIGETYLRIELFDLALTSLNSMFQPLEKMESFAAQATTYILAGINSLFDEAGISIDKLMGIGIGVPGQVDPADDWRFSVPDPGQRSIPLLALLKESLDVPIFQDNDAKTMAQGEMWFKTGDEIKSMIALIIGTGVGAGVISEGALYRGVNNTAGECGHMTIEINGRSCRCGSKGCLEAYVGAPGIIQRLRELDPQSEFLAPQDEMKIIMALVKAAHQNDSVALNVLNETAQYLSVGLASLINMFNPQLILIGGCVGLPIGEIILPRLRIAVERHALRQPLRSINIGLSRLGEEAVSFGAATLVLENFLRDDALYSNFDSGYVAVKAI